MPPANEDGDDSSLNLSNKLPGSNSRDSSYLNLNRGVDSNIDKVTTIQVVPPGAVGEQQSASAAVTARSASSSSIDDEEGTATESEEEKLFVGVEPPSMTPPDTPEMGLGLQNCTSDTTQLVAAAPKVMTISPTPRSVSMILPPSVCGEDSTSTEEHDEDPQTGVPLMPGGIVRTSDDSGIGTAHPMKRQLHIDIPNPSRPLMSRTSSYGGSVSSLPITPKGGGLKSIGHSDRDSLVIILSALYAKLLIILGICFPMAEVISHKIPPAFYEAFYLYLYLGSIFFLLFMYAFVFRNQKPGRHLTRANSKLNEVTQNMMDKLRTITNQKKSSGDKSMRMPAFELKASHAGSFYLRLGAVAFGTGSMIYSGLEFGQFFEYEDTDQCSILHNLTPATRMAFTFFQLYFIFINSRVAINRFTTLARFGLMHMISSNLCVWLHVLIQETKHQIHEQKEENLTSGHGEHARHPGHVKMPLHELNNCGQRANIMGELVQNASPFLFPCTIEYSLICAGVLYIMWKNVGSSKIVFSDAASMAQFGGRQKHYYQVDCAKANKGLFTGILVLVLSIISLILFFVLISKDDYHKNLAVLEAHIAELVVYVLSSLATLIALYQVRELRYNRSRNLDLESILLIVAQSGLYLYNMFSIIGGHFASEDSTMLALLTALACLIQASLQTMFILDASRRYVASHDQAERKPGREMVTFLILCNFSMWAINTLETRRADSNPVQMHFYGFWAWTIITHVTAPLVIFFRFHSTVCLCDIWKRAYKVKSDYLT